jgi:hypothetical protein
VQVRVCAVALQLVGLGHVVVDDNVYTLNVDAAPDQVCGHKDAHLALLEGLVHAEPARARPRRAQHAALCSLATGPAGPAHARGVRAISQLCKDCSKGKSITGLPSKSDSPAARIPESGGAV